MPHFDIAVKYFLRRTFGGPEGTRTPDLYRDKVAL